MLVISPIASDSARVVDNQKTHAGILRKGAETCPESAVAGRSLVLMRELLNADHVLALNRASTIARLVAGLAHEVNNALLVISGTAELLEDRPEAPEAVTKGLIRIRSQSARAAAVISDVLAFVQADPDARGRLDLGEVAAASVALRSWKAGRMGLKLTLVVPEDRRFIVEGSRVQLQQAILNLVGNAEQALAGVPGGQIRLELAEEHGRAVLRVTDSGGGVPADQRARIFEPLVTTRVGQEFAGLGLPAARRIAELHGGTLDLEDSPAGAAFALSLPLA